MVKQDEMLLTVPAGTGRITMEQLLIKNNLLKQGDYFQILLKVKPELSQFKSRDLSFNKRHDTARCFAVNKKWQRGAVYDSIYRG